MVNRITKETRELWLDEITYIVDSCVSSLAGAEAILNYLENEGAFTVMEDDDV